MSQALSHKDNKTWDPETRTWVRGPTYREAFERNSSPGAPAPHPSEHMTQNGALTRSNARKATQIRAALLESLEQRILQAHEMAETPDEAQQLISTLIKGETLRLLTDAEDRGYGKPTQKQELAHSLARQITEEMSSEEAAEIYAREISRSS